MHAPLDDTPTALLAVSHECDPGVGVRMHDLRRVLAAMPSWKRDLIVGAARGGTMVEMAAAQGVPVSTVKSRLLRARELLLEGMEGTA